jgi:predicted transcriptional regulator
MSRHHLAHVRVALTEAEAAALYVLAGRWARDDELTGVPEVAEALGRTYRGTRQVLGNLSAYGLVRTGVHERVERWGRTAYGDAVVRALDRERAAVR